MSEETGYLFLEHVYSSKQEARESLVRDEKLEKSFNLLWEKHAKVYFIYDDEQLMISRYIANELDNCTINLYEMTFENKSENLDRWVKILTFMIWGMRQKNI
ncbi:hypothetical protein [Lactococcus lactis]|uniref:hypothetical protein n=1 Tax=Lactococcus lactis TaxID=1358 RepID=UPI0024A80F0E|nr:hypothetical protein [Lactococcus lactis]